MQDELKKNRAQRGKTITVEEFAAKYALTEKDAERLFRISGPSETDLDILMKAKGIAPR